ncbi:Hypothetical_protein [Hexamita inflata]|uniref:Hypothetical_protein n=1 Tax=Hexamita inflata TaxID=28002 RepID=A0AA86NS60_9EUKA|nr:Hypothetical protein HINF_LOCUS11874 [Hexamita inflata]
MVKTQLPASLGLNKFILSCKIMEEYNILGKVSERTWMNVRDNYEYISQHIQTVKGVLSQKVSLQQSKQTIFYYFNHQNELLERTVEISKLNIVSITNDQALCSTLELKRHC